MELQTVCAEVRAAGGYAMIDDSAERLRVDVRPVFSDELAFELRGMLRARTGQIMLAVLRTMKGRIHPWTSIRLKAS